MSDIYQIDKKSKQAMIPTDTGKRHKEQYVENLKEGDVADDFFAVKMKKPQRTYKRGVFFEFVGTDKTGEISIKYWGGENKDRVKRLYDSFTVGDVVQVRQGNVEIYDERPQISINEKNGGLRRCSPTEYNASDFIPALDESRIDELFNVIQTELQSFTSEPIRRILLQFFEDPEFLDAYKHSPSAITHHHNYVGGNLEHAVGVLRLCKNISEMYPRINKEIVSCGAIIHDIGKLKEYRYVAAIDKTEEGNFIGHIVLGDRWLREKIHGLRTRGFDIPEDLEQHLSHLILSHHGKYEWGSPRLPKTIEACVLHQADLMDSQVKNYIQNLEEAKRLSEEQWAYIYDSDIGRRRAIYLGTY
ncbi:MAG: HD domain-containing protein [Candidatus Thermoplasmatota archaeon]|nr:HD domain-containing protein [Candidatus Thermoplasmatota archaeon]MBU1940142.1 HD domain-containing protein [Candidatus Thermoplasmatota archaeon]